MGHVIGLIKKNWEFRKLGSSERGQVKSQTKLIQWHSASHVIIFIHRSLLLLQNKQTICLPGQAASQCRQFPQIHKHFTS